MAYPYFFAVIRNSLLFNFLSKLQHAIDETATGHVKGGKTGVKTNMSHASHAPPNTIIQ